MKHAGRLLVLVALLAAAGCSDRASGTQRATAPPVPVLVAEAVRRDVPLDVSVIGTVQALTTVGVKSQVSGQVVKVTTRSTKSRTWGCIASLSFVNIDFWILGISPS